MPGITVAANATRLPSRRSALAALAGAGAALSLPKAAKAQAAGSNIAELWDAFLRAHGAFTDAARAREAAYDKLPWWAKDGPSMVNDRGELCGSLSGWPALQDYALPEPGTRTLIRIGRRDIERFASHWGQSAVARQSRDKALADLDKRLAAKQAEDERLGVTALSERADTLCDRCLAHERPIESLPYDSLDVTAAKVLISLSHDTDVTSSEETCESVATAAIALRGMLPHLDALATDAAELVNNPTRPVHQMRFVVGILPGARA